MSTAAAAAFATSPLLSALTGPQLDRLAALGRACRFERGAVILREGDPADAVYAVLEGRVEVVRNSEDGREIVLREIHAGEVAGELAVLHAGRRSATVVCRTPTKCLRVDGADFLALVHRTFSHWYTGMARSRPPCSRRSRDASRR